MNIVKSCLAVSVLLAMAGCGSGSESDSGEIKEDDVLTGEIIISGTVSKGILKQADISAYRYVNNEWVVIPPSELTPSTAITTDDSGVYSFAVPDYTGPVKVELSVNPETKMVCDAPEGCDDIPFNQDYNIGTLNPSFTLSSISNITEPEEELVLNISALTHISAALIESSGVDLTVDLIQSNNSIIANSFGIEGDITKLTPISVNDSNEVQLAITDNTQDSALKYGLVNAGIAQALFANNDEKTITVLLEEAVTDIVEADGAVAVKEDNDSEFELTTNEVLSASAETVDTLAKTLTDDVEVVSALNLLETELVNEKIVIEANAIDGRIQTSEAIVATGSISDQAKAMVNDIRLFTQLFGGDAGVTENFIPQTEAYEALLTDAGVMLDTEADSFSFLDDIALALSDIALQDKDAIEAQTLTSKTYNITDFDSTLTGNVSFNTTTLEFSLTNITKTGQPGLKANLSAAITGLSAADNANEFTLALSGNIDSSSTSLIFGSDTNESLLYVKTDKVLTRSDIENEAELSIKVTEAQANLFLTLEQKETTTVTNPVSFTGNLKATFVPVSESQIQRLYKQYYVESEEIYLPENLTFTGEFSSKQGEQIQAALTVNMNNARDYKEAGLEGFGELIDNVAQLTVSADGNVVTTVINNGLSVDKTVATFTSVDPTDAWTAIYETFFNDGTKEISQDIFTSQDVGLDKKQLIFTATENEVSDNFTYAEQYVLQPIDNDNDNITDWYDLLFYNTSISHVNGIAQNVIAANGLLLGDGSNVALTQYFPEISGFGSPEESFESGHGGWTLLGDLRTVNNMTDVLNRFYEKRPIDPIVKITDLGKVQVNYGILEPSVDKELNGYNVSTELPDIYTSTVNNTLTERLEFIDGVEVDRYTFEATSDVPGNFTYNVNYWNIGEDVYNKYSTEEVEGIDDSVKYIRENNWFLDSEFEFAFKLTFTPIDINNDQLVDHYILHEEHCNANIYSTPEDCVYELSYEGTVADVESILGFDPLLIDDVLKINELRQSQELYGDYFTIEGLGIVDVEFSSSDLLALRNDGAITLDGTLSDVDVASLENDETFLDFSAALSVGLTLDDYDVQLTLSGQRTGLEDGVFALGFNYILPDDSGTRDFTILADTKKIAVDGIETDELRSTVSVTNSAGIKLVLNALTEQEKSTAKDDGSDLSIGTITIDNEVAATVFWRASNEVIIIKYADDTIESIL